MSCRMPRSSLGVMAWTLLLASSDPSALAQAPAPPAVVTRDSNGNTVVRSTPLPEPMVLDGRLDEDMYRTVPSIGNFVQQEPRAGEPSTEQTEIWIFHDAKRVYLAARCWDSHPERDVVGGMRHD